MRTFIATIALILVLSSQASATGRCGRALNLSFRNTVATICVAASGILPGCFHGNYKRDQYLQAIHSRSLDRQARLWALDVYSEEVIEEIYENLEQAEALASAGEAEHPDLPRHISRVESGIESLKKLLSPQSLPGDTHQTTEGFIRKIWPWLRTVYGIPDPLNAGWHDKHLGMRAGASVWLVGTPYTIPEFFITSLHDVVLGWDYVAPFDGDYLERVLLAEQRILNLKRKIDLQKNSSKVFGANHQITLIYHLIVNEDTIDLVRSQAEAGMLPGRKASSDLPETGASSLFGDDQTGTFNRLWLRLRDRVRRLRTTSGQQGFITSPTISVGELQESNDGTTYVAVHVTAALFSPSEFQAALLDDIATVQKNGNRKYQCGDDSSDKFISIEISPVTETEQRVDKELEEALKASHEENK